MTGGGILRKLGRIAAALVAIVILLGTVQLTTWLKNYADDVDAARRPFPVSAAMGHEARARTFMATAQGVRGASIIDDSTHHPTTGVWLIVKVRVTAVSEPIIIRYAAIRDARGRRYVASDRLDGQLAGTLGRELQPGVAVIGEIAFELPRDAATSPTLLLARDPDERMDSQLEIALTSNSPATVNGWADNKQPTTLIPATVAP